MAVVCPFISYHLKCKWIELTIQKAENSGMDENIRPNYMFPSGISSQLQGETGSK